MYKNFEFFLKLEIFRNLCRFLVLFEPGSVLFEKIIWRLCDALVLFPTKLDYEAFDHCLNFSTATMIWRSRVRPRTLLYCRLSTPNSYHS